MTLAGLQPVWVPVAVELAPDELPLDDRWLTAIRVAPPARVRWDAGDRFVATAAEVLREGGRLIPGSEVSLGTLGPGPSVVMPPADPAALGALNRALDARGAAWRYGARLSSPASTAQSAEVAFLKIVFIIRASLISLE